MTDDDLDEWTAIGIEFLRLFERFVIAVERLADSLDETPGRTPDETAHAREPALWRCLDCSKEYSSKDQALEHVQTVHKAPEDLAHEHVEAINGTRR